MSQVNKQAISTVAEANSRASSERIAQFNSDSAARAANASQRAAEIRMGATEARIDSNESRASSLRAEIADPPTMEVPKGGKSGGTKTVVDERALRQLRNDLNKVQSQNSTLRAKLEQLRASAIDNSVEQDINEMQAGNHANKVSAAEQEAETAVIEAAVVTVATVNVKDKPKTEDQSVTEEVTTAVEASTNS